MAKKKVGRPTDYSDKVASKIIERMMAGESLRYIVEDDDMPVRKTIYNWLSKHKEFLHQYTQAREIQADHIFDEMFEIADDGTNDWMTRKQGDDEVEVINHEHIQRSRLRIDTRKWALARMAPKKYGEKTAIVGGDPKTDNPIQIADDPVTVRERARLIAAALHEATKSEPAQGD